MIDGIRVNTRSIYYFLTPSRLPDDIWMVDLDSNKLTPARVDAELPVLPEPEGTILKNHLKQVGNQVDNCFCFEFSFTLEEGAWVM